MTSSANEDDGSTRIMVPDEALVFEVSPDQEITSVSAATNIDARKTKRDRFLRRRAGLSYTRDDVGESVAIGWARNNLADFADRVRRGRPAEVWNYRKPWLIVMSPHDYDEMLKIVQEYKASQKPTND